AVILKLIWLFIRFSSLRGKLKLNNEYYKAGFLKHEMKTTLFATSAFLNYLWLKNYLRKFKHPVTVFYSDEFYLKGRVIAAAAKSSMNMNIRTVGVQHGLYFPNHTVYTITDSELQADDFGIEGLPIPDKFVVWGEYFKE